MSGTFTILPERGLVYVRYEGHIKLEDTERLIAEYGRDPRSAPGQKHLVDISNITGWDMDFLRLIKLQVAKAEMFLGDTSGEFIMVIYAHETLAKTFARHLVDSWRGIPGVLVSLQFDEAAALAILGQSEECFSDLLQSAA